MIDFYHRVIDYLEWIVQLSPWALVILIFLAIVVLTYYEFRTRKK